MPKAAKRHVLKATTTAGQPARSVAIRHQQSSAWRNGVIIAARKKNWLAAAELSWHRAKRETSANLASGGGIGGGLNAYNICGAAGGDEKAALT